MTIGCCRSGFEEIAEVLELNLSEFVDNTTTSYYTAALNYDGTKLAVYLEYTDQDTGDYITGTAVFSLVGQTWTMDYFLDGAGFYGLSCLFLSDDGRRLVTDDGVDVLVYLDGVLEHTIPGTFGGASMSPSCANVGVSADGTVIATVYGSGTGPYSLAVWENGSNTAFLTYTEPELRERRDDWAVAVSGDGNRIFWATAGRYFTDYRPDDEQYLGTYTFPDDCYAHVVCAFGNIAIYERGTGGWSQVDRVWVSENQAHDNPVWLYQSTGASLCSNDDGTVFALSVPSADTYECITYSGTGRVSRVTAAGIVEVFHYEGGTWVDDPLILPPTYANPAQDFQLLTSIEFGQKLWMDESGDRMLIGCQHGNQAYTYKREAGEWSMLHMFDAADSIEWWENAYHGFPTQLGVAVAQSRDGNRAVIFDGYYLPTSLSAYWPVGFTYEEMC